MLKRIFKAIPIAATTASVRMKLRAPVKSQCPYAVFAAPYSHTFFGYYDKTPFSEDGKRLLAMATDCKNGPLTGPVEAHIGSFCLNKPERFVSLGGTTTWCWQQGARLMWHPEQPSNLILYNRLVQNSYGSVVQDCHTSEVVDEFPYPIYDIDRSGRFAASLNFSRLGRLRPGYGYVTFPDDTRYDRCPAYDGVWLCDLASRTKELIVPLDALAQFESGSTLGDAEHYVNHLSFSPSGRSLLFYHIAVDGSSRRQRALVCNRDGSSLVLLNNGRPASHYVWTSDDELLIFAESPTGYGYAFHNHTTGAQRWVSFERVLGDGHPSLLDEDTMLTDLYPSGFCNEQRLLLCHFGGAVRTIAKVHSPFSYTGETRCDLHPRYNSRLGLVCVDVPDWRGRRMMSFDIRNLLHDEAGRESG